MYRFKLGNVLFPIAPSSISITSKSNNETIDLIGKGEVTLMKTPGLREISFKAVLPRVKYPFTVSDFNPISDTPESIIKELRAYRKERRIVPFRMKRKLEKGASKKIKLEQIYMQVTIEDLEQEEDAENGSDIVLTVKLKEYKDFGCKRIVPRKKGGKVGIIEPDARRSKSSPKSYVVKKGDCLYNIAKKQLNNASKWKEIYKLNQKTIEAAAKKHGRKSSSNGHYIYAGTKLKLPS